jgi:hypothetical protein
LSCSSKRSSRISRLDLGPDLSQCGENPSVEGADCDFDSALLAAQVQVSLVVVELGGAFAHDPIHLSKPVELARPSFTTAVQSPPAHYQEILAFS